MGHESIDVWGGKKKNKTTQLTSLCHSSGAVCRHDVAEHVGAAHRAPLPETRPRVQERRLTDGEEPDSHSAERLSRKTAVNVCVSLLCSPQEIFCVHLDTDRTQKRKTTQVTGSYCRLFSSLLPEKVFF